MFMNIYICARRLLLSGNYFNSANFPLCHSNTKGQKIGWKRKARGRGQGPLQLVPHS